MLRTILLTLMAATSLVGCRDYGWKDTSSPNAAAGGSVVVAEPTPDHGIRYQVDLFPVLRTSQTPELSSDPVGGFILGLGSISPVDTDPPTLEGRIRLLFKNSIGQRCINLAERARVENRSFSILGSGSVESGAANSEQKARYQLTFETVETCSIGEAQEMAKLNVYFDEVVEVSPLSNRTRLIRGLGAVSRDVLATPQPSYQRITLLLEELEDKCILLAQQALEQDRSLVVIGRATVEAGRSLFVRMMQISDCILGEPNAIHEYGVDYSRIRETSFSYEFLVPVPPYILGRGMVSPAFSASDIRAVRTEFADNEEGYACARLAERARNNGLGVSVKGFGRFFPDTPVISSVSPNGPHLLRLRKVTECQILATGPIL